MEEKEMPISKQLVKGALKVQQLKIFGMGLRDHGMQHVFLVMTVAEAMTQ